VVDCPHLQCHASLRSCSFSTEPPRPLFFPNLGRPFSRSYWTYGGATLPSFKHRTALPVERALGKVSLKGAVIVNRLLTKRLDPSGAIRYALFPGTTSFAPKPGLVLGSALQQICGRNPD
jgi:hypothetical protein